MFGRFSIHRPEKLKNRLINKYPTIQFFKPSNPNESQIIFAENFQTTDLLEKIQASEPESTSTSEPEETDTDATIIESPKKTNVKPSVELPLQVLYETAVMVREKVHAHSGAKVLWPPVAEDFDVAKAAEAIPIELYNLMAWITGLSDEPELDKFVEVEEMSHLKLLSILQDVVSLSCKSRKFSPKALSLAMTVKHWTGSSKLVRLLNKLGHTVSPTTLKRFETALAQLQLSSEDGIPEPLIKHRPTIFIADNIDYSEETMSGHGTTHHTNVMAVQIGVIDEERIGAGGREDVRSTEKINKRERSLHHETQPIEHYNRQKRKGTTQFVNKKDEFSTDKKWQSNKTDLKIIVMKSFNDSKVTNLPGWTGFNTLLHRDQQLIKSTIAYLPVIEGTPTEMDTILDILKQAVLLADKLEIDEIACVFDLTIYAKIQEIRWLNPEMIVNGKICNLLERTTVRLGEFHQAMSFLGTIGKRFRDGGLLDILVESEIVAQGSVNSILNGHHYNRAVRAHKIMYEALGRLRFHMFLDSLNGEKKTEIEEFILDLNDKFPSNAFKRLFESDKMNEIEKQFYEYLKKMNESCKTFRFWSSYIEMVEQLLDLIRATRTSDWKLHLEVTRAMMPWMFSYDHMNYARYLPVYWLEMQDLQSSHPTIYRDFMAGRWAVQRQTKYAFSAGACDQTMEQTLNRYDIRLLTYKGGIFQKIS